jgi:hypothetical protein
VIFAYDSDMRGVEPSTYKGQWYSKRAEEFRQCVIRRESHGNYRAVNHLGYAGAYQFGRDWQHGLPYMVAAELRAMGMWPKAAKRVRVILQRLPINRWSREMQDIAFFVAYAHGKGMRHWYLAGSWCNRLG